MSKTSQKTGGSAQSGPGLGAGVSSVKVHKTNIPSKGGMNTSPNSASRGKQGNGK